MQIIPSHGFFGHAARSPGILGIGAFQAEEARTVADQMTHEQARTIMRRIANDYDRLAKLAEEQLADQERGAVGDKT
jgi:hypothetical protein